MREIRYRFKFDDGTEWNYLLHFDEGNHLIPKEVRSVKDWTKLETNKCSHCPLNESEHRQCPVARNLDQVVEDSRESISCDRVQVTVEAPERTYTKECATQEGLHSLFGVIMATSGCPHLEWCKPLARFHLPFAQLEEAVFRTLSLQLVTDYFERKDISVGESIDRVRENYAAIETLNTDFIKRIRTYCQGDADKNAIIALNLFAQMFEVEQMRDFSCLRVLFED